jgi:hypothetical protein
VLFARPRLYVDVHGQVLCGRVIGAKNRCPLFRITLKDRPIFLFPIHAHGWEAVWYITYMVCFDKSFMSRGGAEDKIL